METTKEYTNVYVGNGKEYAKIRNGSGEFINFVIEKSGILELSNVKQTNIVEYGVGSGQQTSHLEEALRKSEIYNYKVLALDRSFDSGSGGCQLNVLKDKIEEGLISRKVLPVQYDCDKLNLPIPNGKVDLSYMALVLHHLNNKGEVIKEIGRTSKPGAGFFLYGMATEDLKDSPLNDFFPKHKFDSRRCCNYEELKTLFEQAGFLYKDPHYINTDDLQIPMDHNFLEGVKNKTIDSVLFMIDDEDPVAFIEGVKKLTDVVEESERIGEYKQVVTYPKTVFWGIKK